MPDSQENNAVSVLERDFLELGASALIAQQSPSFPGASQPLLQGWGSCDGQAASDSIGL